MRKICGCVYMYDVNMSRVTRKLKARKLRRGRGRRKGGVVALCVFFPVLCLLRLAWLLVCSLFHSAIRVACCHSLCIKRWSGKERVHGAGHPRHAFYYPPTSSSSPDMKGGGIKKNHAHTQTQKHMHRTVLVCGCCCCGGGLHMK